MLRTPDTLEGYSKAVAADLYNAFAKHARQGPTMCMIRDKHDSPKHLEG